MTEQENKVDHLIKQEVLTETIVTQYIDSKILGYNKVELLVKAQVLCEEDIIKYLNSRSYKVYDEYGEQI